MNLDKCEQFSVQSYRNDNLEKRIKKCYKYSAMVDADFAKKSRFLVSQL